VYVFDCTGKECRTPQTDSDPVSDEVVLIQNPAAGKWKVVIDAPTVPSGSTSFDYIDVVFNPSYGMVNTADLAKDRKVGESWNAQALSWLANAPPAGREPFAAVQLQGHMSGGVVFNLGIFELSSTRNSATQTPLR
jgi:hypothetical protein